MIEARDSGSPQGARPGGQDFWPEDGKGRRRAKRPGSRVPLIAGAGVLAAVLIAGIAVFVLMGGDDEAPAATGNGARISPVAFTPQLAHKEMDKLADRKKDSRPVNKSEVFADDVRTVTGGSTTFTLAASEISKDCKGVTWGTRLHADLAKHGCTQVMRGAYVSKGAKYLGQFIALNLADQKGAEQILRDLDPQVKAGFVYPLNAPDQPAFSSGFSAAYTQAYGHYAVVVWVQRAGGAQPGSLNELIEISIPVAKPVNFVWARLNLVDGR